MVVFGMESLMTKCFLSTLAPMRQIELVVLPAPPAYAFTALYRPNPLMISPASVAELAASYHIPVVYLVRWHELPMYLPADIRAIVCCFPRKLPAWLTASPCYNVHPSLLPTLRGPDPLFYTARGDAPAGITIHRMDGTFDTGPVVVQQSIDTQQCADEPAYIACHAHIAAQLCSTNDIFSLSESPQPSSDVSYAPMPQPADYTLHAVWSQQRIRHFIQCTNLRNHAYWVPQMRCWVGSLSDAVRVGVPCADGILT